VSAPRAYAVARALTILLLRRTHIALQQIRSKFRLLLTGTPIQNNLQELQALLSFTLPEIFGDRSLFQESFDFSAWTSGSDAGALSHSEKQGTQSTASEESWSRSCFVGSRRTSKSFPSRRSEFAPFAGDEIWEAIADVLSLVGTSFGHP
jgi:hypothetical protein